jgi:hypothetical protein
MAAVLPAVLADLTNTERQDQKLPTLTVSPILNQAADMKAKDMATNGYFAHTSPGGKTPWYWLDAVGYKYQYAGENLAINFSDSKDVTTAWMNSPTHRANIVKGNYTEIGTGVASGVYQGRETIFVAQVYANPLLVAEAQSEPTKKAARPNDAVGQVTNTEKIPKVITTPEPKNVLGEQTVQNTPIEPIVQATLLQKSLASPRSTMNTVLFVVFAVIAIALILYVFIKMRNHHRGLITNGLVVLAILGAIFLANYYWTHHNMVISQSLDYSDDNKLGF